MARKSAIDIGADDHVDEAIEEWKELSIVRGEMALEAFKAQSEDVQAVIERMVDRLRLSATGFVTVKVKGGATHQFKADQEFVGYNLMFVATEILKDLALFDVKVGNYEFPPALCTKCGAEIVKTRPKRG